MSLRLSAALAGVIALAACSSPQPTDVPAPPPYPPPAPTLAALLLGAEDLSVLASLVDAADLSATLDGAAPLTVFAPSNEAFAALPTGTVRDLLQPERRDELAALLANHIVRGRVASSDLRDGQALRTAGGETLPVRIANGQIQVGPATLIATNVDAQNGVAHVTDAVLLP